VDEKCRSRPIVGSETLTIVRSMIVMKYATANSANARHRLTFEDVGFIGPPLVGRREATTVDCSCSPIADAVAAVSHRDRLTSRNPTLAPDFADRPHTWGP